MKFLILLVAVVLLVGMLSASLRRLKGPKPPKPKSPASPTDRVQAMRPCAHCGVHMPAKDMVAHGDRVYCSVAHRDAGPAPGAP